MSKANLIRSRSRKACSPDNAACEGFVGRLKTELFYPQNLQARTHEAFIETVDFHSRWYNEQRIQISLGTRSPVEYRVRLVLSHKTSPSFYLRPHAALFTAPPFKEQPKAPCRWYAQ